MVIFPAMLVAVRLPTSLRLCGCAGKEREGNAHPHIVSRTRAKI